MCMSVNSSRLCLVCLVSLSLSYACVIRWSEGARERLHECCFLFLFTDGRERERQRQMTGAYDTTSLELK